MKKTILLAVLIAFAVSTNAQEKYAILICGDSPSEQPVLVTGGAGWGNPGDYSWNEFWNDTFLMWEMLVYEKGYDDNNVYVLYYDGNDYFNINQDARYIVNPPYLQITDHSASKANVEMVFDGLATGTYPFPLVTEDDFLFVWTFGHGNVDGELNPRPVLRLFNQEYISDIEFGNLVNAINANKKLFWMQQENAKDFAASLTTETIISDPKPLAGKLPEEKVNEWNKILSKQL